MHERLTEFPDRRVWDLTDYTVDWIRLSYQVRLYLARHVMVAPYTPHTEANAVTIEIETPFTVRVGSHINQVIPEAAHSTFPVLPLLHQSAVSLIAFRNGTLLLNFVGGTEIEVPQDERYESWHTWGEGELKDIGME